MNPKLSNRLPLCALTLVVLALGAYSSWLNHQFYERQGPFFDSASYTNYLARVGGTYQIDGLKDALDVALDASTAPLPGVEALALAVLHVPVDSSRQEGVWLQVFWLLILALSLFFYWTDSRAQAPWGAVLLTLPFLTFYTMFRFNGGLQDFRLDLSLYIFLGLSVVWYLRTYATATRLPWLLTGLFAMFASLSRATAPVYWTIILGPVIVVRFAFAPVEERKRIARGVAWMLLPVIAIAVPYFVTHFAYLYYYYVQWNADAQAHLPLKQSLFHINAALIHLGYAQLIACAFFFLAALWENRRTLRPSTFDWKLAYIGWAPVLFLVIQGAGLNPFVSMPAVFGWLLFLLAPQRDNAPVFRTGWRKLAGFSLVAAAIWNVAHAPGQVAYPESHMQALRESIDRMRSDAQARNLTRVDYVSIHNWNLQTQFVRNVLLNEYGFKALRWHMLSPEGIPWQPYRMTRHKETSYELPFAPPVLLDWNDEIPGSSDEEKIEWLYQTAVRDIDYVFMPDDKTIDFMEKYISHIFINTKVRAIKKRFLASGEWEVLGGPLAITDFETVELYIKRKPAIAALK